MNKYRNIGGVYKGMYFASQKELGRFIELEALEAAGEISGLDRQVKFELLPAAPPVFTRPLNYIADFVYKDKQFHTIVEDVKGYKRGNAYQIFRIKSRLMLQRLGIDVREV